MRVRSAHGCAVADLTPLVEPAARDTIADPEQWVDLPQTDLKGRPVRYLVCSNCGLMLLLGGRYEVADDCPHCLEARGRAVALLPSESRRTRVDAVTTLGFQPPTRPSLAARAT
jgi:hypothetical protein